MSDRFSPYEEAQIAAIFARLRDDVGSTIEESERPEVAVDIAGVPSRRELDRRWAVTAERDYLYRPGWWGRLRGTLLLAPKALLRRLMRWYVEPLAADQRTFNATLLRTLDELTGRLEATLAQLQQSLSTLEERVARLEQPADSAERTVESSSPRP